MKDSLKKNGYDTEELYFHKLNQELIQKLKRKSSAQKDASDAKSLTSNEAGTEVASAYNEKNPRDGPGPGRPISGLAIKFINSDQRPVVRSRYG